MLRGQHWPNAKTQKCEGGCGRLVTESRSTTGSQRSACIAWCEDSDADGRKMLWCRFCADALMQQSA